ncbi:MAG: hypothetical protein HY721_28455 [Planctomycetes bacterium]|nr:hypothetical protein [Planctomycetota bacterium]
MSRKAKRGVLVSALAGGTAVSLLLLGLRFAATQETWTPRLFAPDYTSGHELAGFSGRPMLLVFGDSATGGWSELLLECEGDPVVAKLLSETFQGVFVDASRDKTAFETYGDPPPGTVLVKDLHGPIRGILEGKPTCEGLRALLEQSLPFVSVEKSPAYLRLLQGTDLLDELVEKRAVPEAESAVRCLKHFEPGSPEAARAEAKAVDLGLSP